MTITYPLPLPTSIGMANIEFSLENAVAVQSSPWTYAQQVFQHQGQRMSVSVSIPPIHRDLAEQWVSFLVALNGPVGTFLMGDPNCAAPQGSAAQTPGTPVVNGAGQTGATVAVSGLPVSATGYLIAGDYIQLGVGATAKLYKVIANVNSDGSGNAVIDIWPRIITAPANLDTVYVSNTVGRFRLSDKGANWSISNASLYGIKFSATQVIP